MPSQEGNIVVGAVLLDRVPDVGQVAANHGCRLVVVGYHVTVERRSDGVTISASYGGPIALFSEFVLSIIRLVGSPAPTGG